MNNFLLGLLLTPGLALAQTQPTVTYPYLIKGKIGQLNAPAKVYLMTGLESADSVTLHNGRFEFKGTSEFPHSTTLVLERKGRLQSGWRDKMFGGQIAQGICGVARPHSPVFGARSGGYH